MRTGTRIFLALILASGLFAQVRGAGSVVNPAGGAGTPGVTRTIGSVVHPAGGPGSGSVVIPAPGSRGAYGRATGVYGYPVYIGGYYSTPYITTPYVSQPDPSLSAPAPTSVTVVMPPQQPVTPVVINNYYGTAAPSSQGAAQDQAPPPDEASSATEPAHYLIALQDHTISIATAYWVDGDTLHYFTAGNVHNQVSLSLVDRAFTQRLNKEAGVDVSLPPPAK